MAFFRSSQLTGRGVTDPQPDPNLALVTRLLHRQSLHDSAGVKQAVVLRERHPSRGVVVGVCVLIMIALGTACEP
ncbi:hypothetical protein PF006_g31988 [Phytophthora fragariae]|uniref:Uncharacterized protein n=1 Tax=Phytophthora fragariae TaxID=53985 RepID=A0A6A3PKI0_9STRA|nr:hypothetical protein PF006_g31988 [Phytophthora fragariae]